MIRPAIPSDASALASIYNPFVLETTITFEEVAVTLEEMASRIDIVTQTLPWFVFDIQGAAVGYAYATAWKARSAYRRTVESAIYVTPPMPEGALAPNSTRPCWPT